MWNHRVVRHKTTETFDGKEEVYYSIHEVYYNSDGSINGMTKDHVAPHGESVKDLEEITTWMLNACAHPVLDYDMEFATSDWEKDVDDEGMEIV